MTNHPELAPRVPITWADRLGRAFDPFRRCRDEIVIARIPVVASIGLFALFFFVPQCRDVFRSLLQDVGGSHARPIDQRFAMLAAQLLSSLAGAMAIWFWARQCLRLLVRETSLAPAWLKEHLPRILAVLPMAAIALKLVTVKTADVPAFGRIWIAGLFCLLAIGLYYFLWIRRRVQWLRRTTHPEAYNAMGYAGAVMALSVFVLALTARQYAFLFGPISVLWLGAAFWTTLLSPMVIYGTRHRLPLLWGLTFLAFFSGVFSWSDNHTIRSSRDEKNPLGETESYARTSVVEGFRGWKRAHPTGPIVFVAAEGGGIYAAYHAGYLLAKLHEATNHDFGQHVFMLSSVSGGTVGSGVFTNLMVAEQRLRESGVTNHPIDFVAATRTILDEDLLSTLLAAAAGPDMLQRFLPFRIGSFDRARGLEDTLEHRWNIAQKAWLENPVSPVAIDWSARGSFWDLYLKNHDGQTNLRTDLPAHFINTTVVETGGRAIVSPYGLPAHGTHTNPTIYHLWAGARGYRIPVPAALTLSARFPIVTPAGRMNQIYLRPVDGPLDDQQKVEDWRFADGGYFENSGIDTLLDVIRLLQAEKDADGSPLLPQDRVRILIVQSIGKTGRSNDEGWTDTLTPLRALMRTRDERADLARARLIFSFPTSFADSTIATDTVPSAPGTPDRAQRELPEPDIPLGWMLSANSCAEIRRQIDLEIPSLIKKVDTLE